MDSVLASTSSAENSPLRRRSRERENESKQYISKEGRLFHWYEEKAQRPIFDSEDGHSMHRSRLWERHRERVIRRQRRLELFEDQLTVERPELLTDIDDWFIYEGYFSHLQNLTFRGQHIPQRYSHRLTFEHRRMCCRRVAQIVMKEISNILGHGSPKLGQKTDRPPKGSVELGLRSLLHIACNSSDMIKMIVNLENQPLRTENEYIRFRCARVLKKVLWGMTKLESCISESSSPALTNMTDVGEKEDEWVIIMAGDGVQKIKKGEFLHHLLSSLSGLTDILEECKKRRHNLMEAEVYRLMTRIELEPKGMGHLEPKGMGRVSIQKDEPYLDVAMTDHQIRVKEESPSTEKEIKRDQMDHQPLVTSPKLNGEYDVKTNETRRLSWASTEAPDTPKE